MISLAAGPCEVETVSSGLGPHHSGCVLLRLVVCGLLGLNLLDALSAIIAERAQSWGADVIWSLG